MEYLSVSQVAEKWGIKQRRIRVLCTEGRIEGAYIESDKFKEMKNYAESKIAENANSKRKEYSLRNNNCGTFAADVLKQDPSVKDKAPVIIDPRPNSIVKEYQDNFKSLNYDPKKRQVKIE